MIAVIAHPPWRTVAETDSGSEVAEFIVSALTPQTAADPVETLVTLAVAMRSVISGFALAFPCLKITNLSMLSRMLHAIS